VSATPDTNEDEKPETELDDEQLETVAGGTLAKLSPARQGQAAPDEAVTFTAIALAESGGNSRS